MVCAVKRIAGVKAIAGDTEVKLPGAAAEHDFEWSTTVPMGAITAKVRHGWITLEGEVEWWCQRNAAGNVGR